MRKKIVVLAGDGIGQEVTESSKQVLRRLMELYGYEFILQEALLG
ncbi:MAG: 3-isopropylmalate dehydrogenase, partial [Bacteroidia bacterium]|nr:3-isopropylmalate dehydrogenase [Bacteroidia bacterium]